MLSMLMASLLIFICTKTAIHHGESIKLTQEKVKRRDVGRQENK